MQRNRLFYLFFLMVLWQETEAQTCIPIDINTTITNPEGISHYECINVSGIFNPDSPWPTVTTYPVWSGTQINMGGETRVSAENAGAVTLFVDPTPIGVKRLVPVTGNALKFEKVEFGLRLPAEAETRIQNFVNETPSVPKLNPFDPLEVDIRAEFEYEFSAYQWELRGKQYGFYYREYELDTTGAGPTWHRNEIPVTEKFRVRYTPDKTGNWRVRFVVYLNGIGTYTTLYSYFYVAPSNNPGYVKVSADGRYFEQGGEFFYPVGQNQAYPDCVSEYCLDMGGNGPGTVGDQWSGEWWGSSFSTVKGYRFYHQVLEKMKAGGANYFRIITNEQGLDIEFEKLGNYFDRMPLAWEMDRILDKSEELGLYMTLDMALQTRYENGSVFGAKAWDWPLDECTNRQYCYNTIPGVDVPTDLLTNATAKRYFKNRLRYMVARYGYSTSIAIWELASEINNMGQGKVFGPGPNCNVVDSIQKPYETEPTIPYKVYKWQDEMLGYIKNDLQHNLHPMGVSYAGDECRLDLGDSSYYSPNVDYIGFNNGGFHLNRFAWLKTTFLPKYASFHKPLIHSEITYVGYENCEQYAEWYKNIWVPPFLGVGLATNWAYQFHLSYPYMNIYGNLTRFLQGSDFRNVNGYTWENDKQDQGKPNLGYKAFMYFMKGVNGTEKRAEGVVLSRNFNFYTNRVHNNTPCDNVDTSHLNFLNFVPTDTIPEDVPYDPNHKLKIPDMDVNGVTQCYKVYWYDPAAGEWFYVKEQYSNVLEGYLTIEHPTLTSQIPGWQTMDLHSGIRPLLAFKVRRCNQEPPEGAEEGMLAQDGVGMVQSDIYQEPTPDGLGLKDMDVSDSGTFIHIFPNPTTDVLQVEVSESYLGAIYKLFSATGSVVEEGRLKNNSVRFSLSGLAKGMYVFKVVRKDGHTETFKIVKQ